MKKLFAILIALITVFAFVSCGGGDDTPANTDNPGKNDAENTSQGGTGSADEYKGNYVFNPPKDNYHIAINDGAVEEARVGDMYSYFENNLEGYSVHINFNREGKVYVPYQGSWYNDTNMSYSDYTYIQDSYPDIFGSMEDGLISYLRAFGTEEDELGEKLKQYYIGNEKICGVNCWIFDSKGINATYVKYWVDPSNGAVLKVAHYQADYIEELSEYNINYTEMDSKFYPSDYDSVGTL